MLAHVAHASRWLTCEVDYRSGKHESAPGFRSVATRCRRCARRTRLCRGRCRTRPGRCFSPGVDPQRVGPARGWVRRRPRPRGGRLFGRRYRGAGGPVAPPSTGRIGQRGPSGAKFPDAPYIGRVSNEDDLCTCGHPRAAHQHYRRGSDCALCAPGGCDRFTRSRTSAPADPAGRPATSLIR